jgi:hypothetical protein
LAPPNFCNSLANATGFKATFNVAPTRRCPDEFYPSGASDVSALFPGKTLLNSSGLYWGYIQGQEDYLKDAKGTTNLSRCMNRSASRGVSGAISGFNITAAGQGYNSSTVSLRLLYAGATRCDNGTGNVSTSCEQQNTISEVFLPSSSTFILKQNLRILAYESNCSASCEW